MFRPWLSNLLYLPYRASSKEGHLAVRLAWPTEITETDFFQRLKTLPKAKTHRLLAGGPEWGPAAATDDEPGTDTSG